MQNAINNIHPNFSLKEAIDPNPLTASPDLTLAAALNFLTAQKSKPQQHTCLLIVEADKLIGIVTELDFVKFAFEKLDLNRVKVGEVMTKNLITLLESNTWDLFYILNLFQKHKIRHLPVLDVAGKLIGLVSQESLRQIIQPENLLKLKQVGEALDRNITLAAADALVKDVIKLMVENRTNYILIGEEEGNILKPKGIITERDIVKFQAENLNLETTLARDVMSYPLFSININESLWQATQTMHQRGIRRLVVYETSGKLAGVITETNLTQAIDALELLTTIGVLQEEIDKRTEKLVSMAEKERLINTIAQQINQSLSVQEILDIVVTKIQKILKVDRVIVYNFFLDWSGTISAESVSDSRLSMLEREIKDPNFEQIFLTNYQQGETKAIEDIYSATKLNSAYRETLVKYRVRANLVVPILLSQSNNQEKSLWGLLIVHQCNDTRKWQEEEKEFLQKLATHLAIAIQQFKLFNLLQKQLGERQEYQKALEAAKEDLETQVNDRTYQILQINEQLQQEIRERKLIEKTLQQANLQLASNIEELQQRQEERFLLGDTINFLQVCLNVEEACQAIVTLRQPLFPETSGAIYKIEAESDRLVAVAQWGEDFKSKEVFSSCECWGLRRSRHHWVEEIHIGLACQHLKYSKSRLETLCLPMTARGETIGMLYFNAKPGKLSDPKRKLALAIAEQTALAIANLKLREKLESKSVRDPVTGLFDRNYSEAFLAQEIDRASRKQRHIGIIILKIENFQELNDLFSCEANEEIIQEISLFLSEQIPQFNVICRYGSDKFLLILPEVTLEDTQQLAEQLQQGIANLDIKHCDRPETKLQPYSSNRILLTLGIACFPQDGESSATLIQAAQKSLETAKTQFDRAVNS